MDYVARKDETNKQGQAVYDRKKAVDQEIAFCKQRLQDAKVYLGLFPFRPLANTRRPILMTRDVFAINISRRRTPGWKNWTLQN